MIDPLESARLATSLKDRFRTKARERGTTPTAIRAQYVFDLVYKRIFAEDDGKWMLLGGNALLIRTHGGRFTQDIDLARDHAWSTPDELRHDLTAALERAVESDPFTFSVVSVSPHSEPDIFDYGARTAKARVSVHLGALLFHQFTIDITQRRHVESPVDMIRVEPVIPHETLAGIPLIPTVPVENHLADKICAMYETHGETHQASNRYRDLADIIRIIQNLHIDGSRLSVVLEHESRRRRIPRPHSMTAPSPAWVDGYYLASAGFAGFPPHLRRLQDSLELAGSCLDDVLAGRRSGGTWDPETGRWID